MTEAEWLACENPEPMLKLLRGRVSDRKLRLFAVACCRRIWPLLTDQRSRTAVAVAEGFAEGTVAQPEFEAARWEAVEALSNPPDDTPDSLAAPAAADAACSVCWHDFGPEDEAFGAATSTAQCCQRAVGHSTTGVASELPAQAALIRDIFSDPFRVVAIAPAWRTHTVLALARGMYESRDFAAMAILADALQDAGCDSEDILDHCRSGGVHVRGCWAVDALLGKE